MPRLKRREVIRRESLEQLTREQQLHLLVGWTYFEAGFADAETFRQAWDLHRDALMEEFRCEYRDESRARPFGWWFVDYGEERPIINPHFAADEIESLRRDDRRGEHFGYLHTSIFGGPDFGPLQENEWDYLERL